MGAAVVWKSSKTTSSEERVRWVLYTKGGSKCLLAVTCGLEEEQRELTGMGAIIEYVRGAIMES